MKLIASLVALCALPLLAQAPPWEVGLQYLPASTAPAAIATQTVHVSQAVFVNNDTADHTVSAFDRSTNCNGGACPIFTAKIPGTTTTPGGTTYAVPLNGVRAVNGVVWYTDANNVIAGWMKGTF